MSSREGGGEFGEEPTKQLRMKNVIRRPSATPEPIVDRPTAQIAAPDLLALTIAAAQEGRRVTDLSVTIEIVDELPKPIAAVIERRAKVTPRIGFRPHPRVALGTAMVDAVRIEATNVRAEGTDVHVIGVGVALRDDTSNEVGGVRDEDAGSAQPDPDLLSPTSPTSPTFPLAPNERSALRDVLLALAIGATLLAAGVLAATYLL